MIKNIDKFLISGLILIASISHAAPNRTDDQARQEVIRLISNQDLILNELVEIDDQIYDLLLDAFVQELPTYAKIEREYKECISVLDKMASSHETLDVEYRTLLINKIKECNDRQKTRVETEITKSDLLKKNQVRKLELQSKKLKTRENLLSLLKWDNQKQRRLIEIASLSYDKSANEMPKVKTEPNKTLISVCNSGVGKTVFYKNALEYKKVELDLLQKQFKFKMLDKKGMLADSKLIEEINDLKLQRKKMGESYSYLQNIHIPGNTDLLNVNKSVFLQQFSLLIERYVAISHNLGPQQAKSFLDFHVKNAYVKYPFRYEAFIPDYVIELKIKQLNDNVKRMNTDLYYLTTYRPERDGNTDELYRLLNEKKDVRKNVIKLYPAALKLAAESEKLSKQLEQLERKVARMTEIEKNELRQGELVAKIRELNSAVDSMLNENAKYKAASKRIVDFSSAQTLLRQEKIAKNKPKEIVDLESKLMRVHMHIADLTAQLSYRRLLRDPVGQVRPRGTGK